MDHELSPIGKLDKLPLLGMFVTTHFKRRKDKNIRYAQPSIMQH
jgi:hypothetical protein